MQQFSTTLAGSHSPHDQSNSLSLSALAPRNCMRHAPRTVAREELQFEGGKLSAVVHHGAFRTRLNHRLSSASRHSRADLRLLVTSSPSWWSRWSAGATFSTRDSGRCRPYWMKPSEDCPSGWSSGSRPDEILWVPPHMIRCTHFNLH